MHTHRPKDRHKKSDSEIPPTAHGSYPSRLRQAALEYMRHGLVVLPCRGTEPADVVTFLEAGRQNGRTTTWLDNPECFGGQDPTLAIATGRISNLVVVNCQNTNGKDGIQAFEDLCAGHHDAPSAVWVETPAGDRHYYYGLPSSLSPKTVLRTTQLAPGVEARGEGSCTLAPPSRLNVGGEWREYVFHGQNVTDRPVLGDWLVKWLSGENDGKTDSSSPPAPLTDGVRSDPGMLRKAVAWLQRTREDQRSQTLHVIAFNLGRYSFMGHVSREDAYTALFSAAIRGGLSEEEAGHVFLAGFQEGYMQGPFAPKEPRCVFLDPEFAGLDELIPEEGGLQPDEYMMELPPPPLTSWPKTIRHLVEVIAETRGVPVEMVVLYLLGLGSACTGYSRVLRLRKNWREPALLWLLMAADSGTGKSHTLSYIFKYLNEAEGLVKSDYKRKRQTYEKEMVEYRKNRSATACPIRPVNIQYTIDDPTIEAVAELLEDNQSRGLAMIKDEAFNVFENLDKYQKRGSSKERLLSMYDGGPWKRSRKNQDGTSQELYLHRAALSFCGGIQTRLLPRFFAQDDGVSGFAQRFIIVCAQAMRPMEFDTPDMSEEDDRLLKKITYNMLNFTMLESSIPGLNDPVEIGLDTAAEAVYRDFYNRMSAKAFYAGGEEGSYLAKVIRNAARIALVLYALEQAAHDLPATECLPVSIMEAAIRTALWMDIHRQYLSPFTQLKKIPSPVDRVLARCVVGHAEDIRAMRAKVPVQVLKKWLDDGKGLEGAQISEETLGRSASRLGMPPYRTAKARMRIITDEVIGACARMTEVMDLME